MTITSLAEARRRKASAGGAIVSVNPANGATLAAYPALSDGELDDRLALAVTAFHAYRATPVSERAQKLQRVAELLEAQRDDLGRLITDEMGKLLVAAGEEI